MGNQVWLYKLGCNEQMIGSLGRYIKCLKIIFLKCFPIEKNKWADHSELVAQTSFEGITLKWLENELHKGRIQWYLRVPVYMQGCCSDTL